MENFQVDGKDLMGIIVNLTDYTIGADKGGAVEMFEDFDIDYNKEKYLIETRCSGALTMPYSAIVLFKGSTLPTSVDGDVKRSKTEYIAVTPEQGDNPAQAGWYVKVGNKYVQTTDTTVQSGTTYYRRVSHIDD